MNEMGWSVMEPIPTTYLANFSFPQTEEFNLAPFTIPPFTPFQCMDK